jgi:hypothetical protein
MSIIVATSSGKDPKGLSQHIETSSWFKKNLKKLISLTPVVTLTGLIGILALLASTYLSAKGIHYALAKADLDPSTRFAVSAFGTFLLTGLAFTLWMRVGRLVRARKIRRAIGQGGSTIPMTSIWLAVLFSLAVTSLSVTTATVALTHINHHEAIQQLQNRQTFHEIIAPVETMTNALGSVARESENGARFAAERSEEERTVGNTCAPIRPTRPGPGPVTDMRAAHAVEAEGLAERARSLAKAAQTHIAKLSTAENQQVVIEQVRALRSLRNGPELGDIAAQARSLSSGYGEIGFLQNGERIYCSDSALRDRFVTIGELVDAVPNLPVDTPIRREATIFDTFAMLNEVITGSSGARAVGLHPSALTPFVILAALFDLISAIGACAQGALSARRLDDEDAKLHRQTLWIIEHFFVLLEPPSRMRKNQNNKVIAYFICPIVEQEGHGNPKYMKGCKYLIEHFNLNVEPHWQYCELDEVHPKFTGLKNRWRFASGGATHFDVYAVQTQEILDEILSMKRSATLLLGLDYQPKSADYPDFILPKAA